MPNLLHTKNSRTQIYKTLPSNDVGSDGDIILSQIKGRGVFLCSKINGKWHVSNKMEELRKIEKTSINDLKLNRLKIGTSIITKNEESLRRLQEQQKQQSQILDGIISTTDDLMKDVKTLKKEL